MIFLEYFPAFLGLVIALYGVLILISGAIYIDARKRGHTHNLWLTLALFFGILGLVILSLSSIEPPLLKLVISLMFYLIVPLVYIIVR